MSNVSAVSTGSKWCIEIAIINDNRPEPDESFTVKFSKVTDQCGVNGGSGSGGGDDQGMLQPMTNAVALITIKDDDFLGTCCIHSTACGIESPNKSKMKVYNVMIFPSLTSIEKTFLCLINV